jgi:carboxypeptidase C (cathepsin A)
MKRPLPTLAFVLLALRGLTAGAAGLPVDGGPASPAAAEAPRSESVATRHRITLGGATIGYTATCGTLVVRDAKGQPYASIGYTAYTRDDTTDPASRPLLFAFNGGPGSSSIWLHMGALGPRRIITADAAFTPPPPYRTIDNDCSPLDRTDLVLVDPVGTGFSHAVGEAKDADFFGVDPDIESLSRFIRQYVTDNGRWNSPKYLLGESYGSTRSAGIVDYLQENENLAVNGVILIGLATDFDALLSSASDDPAFHPLSVPLLLPSCAAVAWYHHALPERPAELAPFLAEARAFALGDYAHALALGSNLAGDERQRIIGRLRHYTGLSEEYLDRADLKILGYRFMKELLRDNHETMGGYDGRFLGSGQAPLAEAAAYDPSYSAVAPAFAASFFDYIHRDLGVGPGRTYIPITDLWLAWNYRHKIRGTEFPQPMANTGVDLAHAMCMNPHLRVLVAQGLYDLATPLLATEYMVSHLDLPPEARSRVEIRYFEAGHMLYLHEPSLRDFAGAVRRFIGQAGGS